MYTDIFAVRILAMVTPDDAGLSRDRKELDAARHPTRPPDTQGILTRIDTPLGELLMQVAMGLDAPSVRRDDLLRSMLKKGRAGQKDRSEIFDTLEELLAYNLQCAPRNSLEPSEVRTGLLELAASIITQETTRDMERSQCERWVRFATRELARLTCVDSWEGEHTQQLEPVVELMNELLSVGEKERPLSSDTRERLVLSVGRFLSKVEGELFRGTKALELSAPLRYLCQISGLLREPLFADKLEDLCVAALSLCEYLTPDCFGEDWRSSDALERQALDESDELDTGNDSTEADERGQDDEPDDDFEAHIEEIEDQPEDLAADLLHDLLISFRLSGGEGRDEFWSTMVESISHDTTALDAALKGLSTCSPECLKRTLRPLLMEATKEPTALAHVVNLMCARELYKGLTATPCDEVVKEVASTAYTSEDREALRKLETRMFEEMSDLIEDPQLAQEKLSMLR